MGFSYRKADAKSPPPQYVRLSSSLKKIAIAPSCTCFYFIKQIMELKVISNSSNYKVKGYLYSKHNFEGWFEQ